MCIRDRHEPEPPAELQSGAGGWSFLLFPAKYIPAICCVPALSLIHILKDNFVDKGMCADCAIHDKGTGKSFFAGCIANALLDQDVPVLMTNFPTILNLSLIHIYGFYWQALSEPCSDHPALGR